MSDVGNVYAHLPVTVGQLFNREGIVEVLCVLRVDGECDSVSEVATLGDFFGSDVVGNAVGSLCHSLGVAVGQPILRKDSVDFGIVVAGSTQHINHLAHGAIGIVGPLHYSHYGLVAAESALELVFGDKYVGGEEFAVGEQIGVVFLHLKRAYEHLVLLFEHFNHFGFGLASAASCADVHTHLVAIESVHRVALGNEN